ncbi:endo-1,4-beta-xylanase A precursor [bacterium BMS3Bbin02]|nr:endo-1,4-beta-xylanase A precursor [bacterium BMS3Bbin02]
MGIVVDGMGSPVIRDNDIRNSGTDGIRLADAATFGAGSTANCLIGNGSGVTNTTGAAVTFVNNWWGVSSGPSGQGSGAGDSVGIDIDYTPWLNVAPTGCEAGPTFGDVPVTDTFYDDIEWLAAQGITRGCNPPDNSLFCPNDSVTRAQMAAFLRRALEGALVVEEAVTFTDIGGSVFGLDIEWLGSVGVTKGCNPPVNDRFCPDDVVTRGQMAAFLVRAFSYTAGSGSNAFGDDDGSIFESDIERLAQAGVTLGCNPPTNDLFCPDDPVTRGQMAAFLRRALG